MNRNFMLENLPIERNARPDGAIWWRRAPINPDSFKEGWNAAVRHLSGCPAPRRMPIIQLPLCSGMMEIRLL